MIDVAMAETGRPSNDQVSELLHEVAGLLEEQAANPFRVAAYRAAAETLRQLDQPVWSILEGEGVPGLLKLKGVGKSIANAISLLVRTGRLPLLERLRGDHSAERIFATVPDIGSGLAKRIHEQLGIESLSELQAAAIDGRLASVPGMGNKRIRAVRESLASRLRFTPDIAATPRHAREADPVPIAELLEVDAEYRHKAEAGKLPRIVPRRFNPTGAAWLPILHTLRGDRHYTALYSNTARAHEMDAIHDWVVIYRDDEGDHGRWTAITSQFGKLRGRRIIRGREAECREHYEQHSSDTETAFLDSWK